MDRLQLFQIDSILWSFGKALETDNAGNEQVRVSCRPYTTVEDHAEPANDNVLQTCRVGVGYDANEIRTRGLVLGHCQPSRKQRDRLLRELLA